MCDLIFKTSHMEYSYSVESKIVFFYNNDAFCAQHHYRYVMAAIMGMTTWWWNKKLDKLSLICAICPIFFRKTRQLNLFAIRELVKVYVLYLNNTQGGWV